MSLDQAAEIASAAGSAPGAVGELIDVARNEGFHVLRDDARKAKLEAEQHRGLAERQKEARSGRSYTDDLGMVNINLRLEPHVGAPLAARAEAEAQRLRRADKQTPQSFERYLADAYTGMLAGSGVKGPARRPELVVVVSHEVVKRGWRDVRPDELCKIPGVGPVAPEVAREIAQDAFLTGVSVEGKELRLIKRWTRNIPVEVRLALELGDSPGFDGVRCDRCGRRFRPEFDHTLPHAAGGEASKENMKPLCPPCHIHKTDRGLQSGKAQPPRSVTLLELDRP